MKKRFSSNMLALSLFLSIWAQSSQAASLREHLEFNSSVAQSYRARNVFVNPAGLAYETEQNGTGLLGSFGINAQRGTTPEVGFNLSYGYLGFGFESLANSLGTFQRYGFAFAIPLNPDIYLGTRYSFTNSNSSALQGFHSWDVGVQYRPAEFLSIGVTLDTINRPAVGGTTIPAKLSAGAAIRPLKSLEITWDVASELGLTGLSNPYTFGGANYELVQGLQLQAGYHSIYQLQIGARLSFELGSVHATLRPDGTSSASLIGGEFFSTPSPSIYSPDKALSLTLNSALTEDTSENTFFGGRTTTLFDVLSQLEKATRRSDVRHVFVHITDFPLGLAAASDISSALTQVKEAGKTVHVHFDGGGMAEYIIANAADKITMPESATLEFTGFASRRYYLKGTLDKIGIEAEVIARGEYKSAPESFTRKDPSPADRLATKSRLKEIEVAVKSMIAALRPQLVKNWENNLAHGLFSPEEALRSQWIDEVASLDNISNNLQEQYLVVKRLDQRVDRLALRDRIAVIVADGDIMKSKSGILGLGGYSQITPQDISEKLKTATSDSRTKAVVLRISSPGGEILASQQIGDAITHAASKKPVYVSMGDSAASGGYFMATSANKIFASPLTQTGSIGVFMGKANLSGLYEKIGLRKEILTESPTASLYSEHRALSPSERSILSRRADQYYESFVSRVAKFRRLDFKQAENASKGRVWIGSQAKDLKLVDDTIGFLQTLQFATNEISGTHENVESYLIPSRVGLLGMFNPTLAGTYSPFSGISKDLLRQVHNATQSTPQFLYLQTDIIN